MSLAFGRIRVGWLALAVFSLVATACGEKGEERKAISEAQVKSFVVEPDTIVEGEAAVLR